MDKKYFIKDEGMLKYSSVMSRFNLNGLLLFATLDAVKDYFYVDDPMVWLLYPDGSRELARDLESIERHNKMGGLFGIADQDFQRVTGRYGQVQYQIYQIKQGSKYRSIRFQSLGELQEEGGVPNLKNYDFVYEGKIKIGETLENLFVKFNLIPPKDFVGHSISVSDIVVTDRNERLNIYYVDSCGFTSISDVAEGRDVIRKFDQGRDPVLLDAYQAFKRDQPQIKEKEQLAHER